jgi:hypothetical protein
MKDMNQKFKEYLRNEFTIERDGVTITLTSKELREIRIFERARDGFDSLGWYLDTMNWLYENKVDENAAQKIKDAEAMMEDFYCCLNTGDMVYEALYYDSGEIEREAVDAVICDYQQDQERRMCNE